MGKKWHKNGCGETTYPKDCPNCQGWGYRNGIVGKLTCSRCQGSKTVCSTCKKPY